MSGTLTENGSIDTNQDNPFDGMKIKDCRILDEIDGRSTCPSCNKSRKYFCYTCYIPVPPLKDIVPKVKLPVKIDIIKHSREIDGKSTAAHAAVIAPDDVTIYTYPCIPDYPKEENVVLIFPGKNAQTIEEYINAQGERSEQTSEPECKRPCLNNKLPITRAVFIDSTWNQSRGIYKDERLRAIPCVVFQSRISQFWRHQHGSPRWFLATIEAVHQFLVELHILCRLGNYSDASPNKSSDTSEKLTISMGNNCQNRVITVERPSTVTEESNIEAPNSCQLEISVQESDSDVRPDKKPSKFVKNLALCRGIRVDPGGEAGVKLLGPEQWKGKYGGEYDDLLFFFQFMYNKIHSIYDHDKLRSYQRPID